MSSEWQQMVFSDLVDFVSDKAQAKDTNLLTYISTENMEPDFGGVKTAATLPKSGSVTKFKLSDTLFSNIRTYFKKVWQAEFDGHCSNDVLVFRSKDQNKLLPNYLHNLCRWERFTEFSVRTSKGAKMPRGDKDALVQFQYELPPIEEQLVISETLDTLDDRITLLLETNATLEAIAQTLFKSWFVDFDPVRAKQEGRVPEGMDEATAALFPNSFEESELGLVPKGWVIRKAESLLTRLSTKVRYTKEQVQSTGAIPVYEQGAKVLLGYHNGYAQFQATPNEPIFIFGDHTCVTHLSCEPFDISMNVIAIKGSDRPTLWTYYAIKDKQTFQEYRRHWMELAVKEIIVPPIEICLEFSNMICPIHLKIESNARQINTLASLRDTLLPRLISGQLRLPEAETSPEEITP